MILNSDDSYEGNNKHLTACTGQNFFAATSSFELLYIQLKCKDISNLALPSLRISVA